MGGYVAHDAVASATRSPLSLKRHSMLTWTEKGERLDGEMHSINLFSDAYTRQVEALTHKSPFRRLIQSTHNLPEETNVSIQKMLQAVREFNGYITANEHYIVNYGDRYRNGETISTALSNQR
jgi:hypothetical protein